MTQSPPIVRMTLTEAIRTRLREEILSGTLAPGDRLTEQGVAERMGTSAGPVREALATLAQEGLVIALPNRGTFVSSVSQDEARDAYELRALLEPYAFERTMARMTPAVISELRAILASWRKAARRADYAEMISLDMQFHGIFYNSSGNVVLVNVWPVISATIRKFVAIAGPQYNRDYPELVAKHERLLELVERGDLAGVKTELAEHGQDIWRNMPDADAPKSAKAKR